MPDDQHDGRRVCIGGGQIERFHRAGNLGFQLEHHLDLGRQCRLVDCGRIEGYMIF
jgi:hypothetical protein